MSASHMTLYSGRRVNPWDIKLDDLDIQTIAHSLSMLCRFGGHSRQFYSVAQHCVRAAGLLPPELALEGLLHDATESIVQDLVRPVKRKIEMYHVLEDRIWSLIAFRFGFSTQVSKEVVYADNLVLKAEIQQFLVNPGRDEELKDPFWADYPDISPAPRVWTPEEAEGYYLMMYTECVAKRIQYLKSGQVTCSRCTNGMCRPDCALYSEMIKAGVQ